MLPASSRLSHKKAFAIVFKEGQYAAHGALSIKWRSTHPSQTRVGFIANKKNFTKARARNRAKRLLREATRPLLFQLRPGFDIIILYRYKPEQLDLDTVAGMLRMLLEKNNLLQKIS
ncbi:MAG: ribonuclease P protein component [Candidatus Moranbacteria bacterium]|nr:ribonuclease P protein component [Candidatus Moranbacteria bacterium]